MTRNEFNLLYAIKKYGIQSYRKMKDMAFVSVGYVSQTMKSFSEQNYIDDNGITVQSRFSGYHGGGNVHPLCSAFPGEAEGLA